MIIRCKSCGKNIQYDIARQKLHCDQCGSNFGPEEFPDDSPTFDACAYTCQSCGAKLITTENTEATAFCSYCGSTSILTERMNKIKKPDAILPFRITREQCREIYLKQAKKTFLVPGWLKSDQCVNSFRAIYMPYWSYKVNASGHVARFKTSIERDGDYIVETESHYASEDFDKDVAVWSHDSSIAFADDISEMMDFNEVEEIKFRRFHEGYLSGFYADLADDTAKSHKRIAEDEMKARLGGSDRTFIGKVKLTEHKLKYMPVWFMSTRYKNKVTYAAINGYNGKIVADFPVSTRRFLMIAIIAAAIMAAILSMVLVLRPEPAFWCSAILALAGLVYCEKEEERLYDMMKATGVSMGEPVYLLNGGKVPLRFICFILTVILAAVLLIKYPNLRTPSCVFFFLIMGFFILAAVPKREITFSKKETVSQQFLISIIACILAGLLILTRNNMVIYGVVLFYALVVGYYCISVFRVHQAIASRRPPQFNRRGAKYDA